MKFKNTKIQCDIKKKSLSTENMKAIKGGWCCGRPPRRGNGNGNNGNGNGGG